MPHTRPQEPADASTDQEQTWRHRVAVFIRANEFPVAVVFCLVVELLMLAFPGWGVFSGPRDELFDAVTRIHALRHEPPCPPRQANCLKPVLVHVDEKTWSDPNWGGGEPLLTPRDRLGELLLHAFNSGARFVFLDITLDGKATEQEQQAVFDRLRQLPKQEAPRHLLVTRSVRNGADGQLELRPAAWDTFVPPDGLMVHNVSTLFLKDSDQVVRHWQMSLIARTSSGGEFITLPSPQWVMRVLRTLEQQGEIPATHNLPWKRPVLTGRTDIPQAHAIENRVIYGLPAAEPMPCQPSDGFKHAVYCPKEFLEYQSFANSFVAIGNSFAEARDDHLTPLGMMPGVHINLNAVNSILRYGELSEPAIWQKALIGLAISLLVAWIFHLAQGVFWPFVSLWLVMMTGVFQFGPELLRSGMWLDFAAPVFVAGALRIFIKFTKSGDPDELF